MNTLTKLKNGQLRGSKKLTLKCGLTQFPMEIYELAETLEVLDMSDNQLSSLPDDFAKLKNLKIVFLSNNLFIEFPSVLAQCLKLSMIGIRNNQIHTLGEDALPLSTRWLILTDNALESLPESLGSLKLLQKCMLSGNRLRSLPKSMRACKNLELLRLSANSFETIPEEILDLPKLSWLAYGGNPFCAKHPNCDTPLKEVSWQSLELGAVLGEGASGMIYQAMYRGDEVAVKVFKGEMTSDGLPKEERDINISMGHHEHLVDVLAKVTAHPEGNEVLMLELIPSSFFNLGLPPTLATCTRDVYPKGFTLTLPKAITVLQSMADAAVHMHERGIMHGDFYAHNIMIDSEANSILGDFGGASYYEPTEVKVRQALERLEARAFGCLIEEMLALSKDDKTMSEQRDKLLALKATCMQKKTTERPLFTEIKEKLSIL
ncbi:MAG: leucine-rich repeat-containing protein kinase family protein [Campylobacterota bacterium]|nr:leucine-rich repeat-containing protein kinase family protein [Campylobacterota bacterium]